MNLNRRAAVLSGLVCPGLGQLYKKEKAKGAIIVSLIAIDLLWLFVRIMKLVWRTVTVTGPGGIEAMKLDPQTMAELHRAAWIQNWWLLAIFVAIWIYAIIDAAYTESAA